MRAPIIAAARQRLVDSALVPGAHIDRFRLCAKLGQGAAGIVFAAEDELRGCTVALKILRQCVDSDQRSRFLREADLAASAEHPNLAAVFEAIDTPDYSLIVMELVSGRTLRAHLKEATRQGRRLSLEEALRIVRRLARGLAAAHNAGVIHRDVKPENVMIREDGQPKLLDFGIAKVCPAANQPPDRSGVHDIAQMTRHGMVLGTPPYMSPEHALGDPIGPQADVFSVGVMLYEMLTGTRPFVGASTLEVLLAIAHEKPAPPSWHCLGIDPRLEPVIDRVVLRCLEKDFRRRYADASELLRDLMALSRLVALSKIM